MKNLINTLGLISIIVMAACGPMPEGISPDAVDCPQTVRRQVFKVERAYHPYNELQDYVIPLTQSQLNGLTISSWGVPCAESNGLDQYGCDEGDSANYGLMRNTEWCTPVLHKVAPPHLPNLPVPSLYFYPAMNRACEVTLTWMPPVETDEEELDSE